MREILFRGKTLDGRWVEGSYGHSTIIGEDTYIAAVIYSNDTNLFTADWDEVIPETVGQYTGLTDKNGKKIFEGNIVQYQTFDDFDCQSVVKFGKYKQDGSSGEYSGTKCIGFYVEVDNFTCPDWCEDEPECFPNYIWQQNILEVASECEIIGNIYDNPELLSN